MRNTALFVLPTVGLLAACGGGSTGPSGTSFAQLASSGVGLLNEYQTATVTPVQQMPIGTATYRGVAAYSSDYSDPAFIVQYAETLSAVELTANFDANTISGTAHNFRNIDPALTIAGSLAVNGSISDNTFQANIGGTLTESYQGVSIPVTWSGNVGGSFVGDSANALGGGGTAFGDAGVYGTISANTVFVADRQ